MKTNRTMSTIGDFSVTSGKCVVFFCFHFCPLTSRPFIPLARKPDDVSFRLAVDLSWLTGSLSNLQNNLRVRMESQEPENVRQITNQMCKINTSLDTHLEKETLSLGEKKMFPDDLSVMLMLTL